MLYAVSPTWEAKTSHRDPRCQMALVLSVSMLVASKTGYCSPTVQVPSESTNEIHRLCLFGAFTSFSSSRSFGSLEILFATKTP